MNVSADQIEKLMAERRGGGRLSSLYLLLFPCLPFREHIILSRGGDGGLSGAALSALGGRPLRAPYPRYLSGQGSAMAIAEKYKLRSGNLVLDWAKEYHRHRHAVLPPASSSAPQGTPG